MASIKILNAIYALRESDRSDGLFHPVVETKDLVWHFEISEFDKLGLLLNHIAINARNASPLSLEKQFEQLKNTIRYLDDFKLVEYDRRNSAMLLRSSVPKRLGDAVRYYEIVLKEGNQLGFERYEFDRATGRRRMIPANLSRETFEELLVDFETIFSPS